MRQLKEYEPYLTTLLSLFTEKLTFSSAPPLQDTFENQTRLVVAFNHAAPLSWVPAVCLLTKEVCAAGGGDRFPRGIMDQFFFQFPLLRPLARYISQSEDFMNFDQLVDHFESAERADLVVFPEGSNCFFGPSDEIQEFRSPRFIEIAIRAQAPILIVVHSGSESWGQTFSFPSTLAGLLPFLPAFAQKGIMSNGVVNVPMLPNKIEDFRMHCELYTPELKLEDLSEDRDERRAQLTEEASKVHAIMESTLVSLKR